MSSKFQVPRFNSRPKKKDFFKESLRGTTKALKVSNEDLGFPLERIKPRSPRIKK